MDLLARHRGAIAGVHRGLFHLEAGSPVFDCPEKFSIARAWSAGGPPLQNWYEFQCSRGMTKPEACQAFAQALPLMRSFNPFSTHLSYFRDHAGDLRPAGSVKGPPHAAFTTATFSRSRSAESRWCPRRSR